MRSTLDLIALEPQELVALLIATSFAAGLNVYATVATLGLLSQFDVVVLPAPLAVLESWWVIGACGLMFAVEFFADKIPAFDLIWNALHTFVRVPVAALLAYGAAAPLSPGWQLGAAALGGLVAFAAHAGKTAMRAAVTPSPEPLSNIGLSLVEDAVAIGLTWFAVNHPYIAAGIVVVMIVMMIVAIRMVVAALGALYRSAMRVVRSPVSAGPT
jgi:hypothetical protein